MGRRVTSLALLLGWFIWLSLSSGPTHADNWPELVVDNDGDGLADSVETAGWRNAAGGPFKTNPLKPDSDGDGLTDGEEKLFDTHPLNKSKPGIWVEYEAGFQTRQYFHPSNNAEPSNSGGGPSPVKRGGGYFNWKEGGHRRILADAIVVRQGASFLLRAPAGASLTLTKYNSQQTNLTVRPVLCEGSGWEITVPADSTAGIYEATATLGTWTDKISIYVIFELPQPHPGSGFNGLTQADINTFLYDDDPTNLRDETAVWWIPRETKVSYSCANYPGQPCDNELYKTARAFAQAFYTDQFKKYIFRNRVMPAISGISDPLTASDSLADAIDDEIRVRYSGLAYSSYNALNRTWDGTGYTQSGWGCDVHAMLLSGYSRAAGVLARPFQVDWTSSTDIGGAGAYHGETATGGWNDNSVLVWNGDNWRVLRAYSTQELDDLYYPWDTDGVHIAPSDLTSWARNRYYDQKGDLIVTANSTWQFSDINTVWPILNDITGSNGNFGKNWEYLWESRKPLQIQRNPMVLILNELFWKGDGWKPNDFSRSVYLLPDPYPGGDLNENWPIDPVAVGCSPGTINCPFGSSLTTLETNLDRAPANNLSSVTDNFLAGAKFNDKVKHQAVDTDRDGSADAIVVELGLTLTRRGTYSVMADLYDLQGQWLGTASWRGSSSPARLQFTGVKGHSGPYILRGIYLMNELGQDFDGRSQIDLSPLPAIESPAKVGIVPAGKGVTITPNLIFNHSTPDADGDGRKDQLIIEAGMTVSQAGTYRLEGWLTASNGKLVGWVQSPPTFLDTGQQVLSLVFDGRVINDRGLPGPYTLEELKVLDGNLSAFNVLDKVQQTGLNLPYSPDQFETTALFADNMEAGNGLWRPAGVWSLDDKGFFSPTHAWKADAGSSQDSNLTLLALDASAYTGPVLRFQSCSEAGGTPKGYVEVSTNGSTWTRVGTYATKSEDWVTKSINLSSFGGSPNLQVRFRANTNSGSSLKWFVDDVHLNGWTGPTGPLQGSDTDSLKIFLPLIEKR